MKGRTPTKKEKQWLNKIGELGCIVCRIHHGVFSPASPHHIEGRVKPGAHFKTIPLCFNHHQADDSYPEYESVHGNKYLFEERYGTQWELLEKTKEIVNGGA